MKLNSRGVVQRRKKGGRNPRAAQIKNARTEEPSLGKLARSRSVRPAHSIRQGCILQGLEALVELELGVGVQWSWSWELELELGVGVTLEIHGTCRERIAKGWILKND